MHTFLRSLVAIAFLIGLSSASRASDEAQRKVDFNNWVSQRVDQDLSLDLDVYCAAFPQRADEPDCHNLDQAELTYAIQRAKKNDDLKVRHATFPWPVDLSAMTIPETLDISDSTFAEGLRFVSATLKQDLYLRNDRLPAGLAMDGVIIGGRLILDTIDLRDKPLTLREAKVENDAILSKVLTEGPIEMTEMTVGSDLRISHSLLMSETNLYASHIGRSLLVSGSTFGELVNIHEAQVGEDIIFDSTRLLGGLDGVDSTIHGLARFNAVSVESCERERGVTFRGAKINGNLEANKLYVGKLIIGLAKIGNVFIHDASFETTQSGLLNGAAKERDHKSLIDTLDGIGLVVDGHFDIGGTMLWRVNLTRASIGGDLRLAQTTKNQTTSWLGATSIMILTQAHINCLQDDIGSPTAEPTEQPISALDDRATNEDNIDATRENAKARPDPWPPRLTLEGFGYDRFGSPRKLDWAEMWIARDFNAEPQTYKQLANVFVTENRPEIGDDILYKGKEADFQRDWHDCHVNNPSACLRAGGSALLWVTIGFGIGERMFRVFYSIAILVIIGVCVLWKVSDAREKGFVWCVGASLNALIPLVDFNREFKDFFFDPNRVRFKSWQLTYFGAHAAAGYVLATFVAAAFAGLTQSR